MPQVRSGLPLARKEIASWAIATGAWKPSRASLLAQCAEDMARAMREEHITDKQGRRVRPKHAARFGEGAKQRTLWADIRTADPMHMEVAFKPVSYTHLTLPTIYSV